MRSTVLLLVVIVCSACRPEANGRSDTSATRAAVAGPAFPLRTSANGRYLVDQNGVPVPVLGRTAWFAISIPATDFTTFLSDTIARGYDAIEMHVLDHDPRGNNPPRNGNGDLPFLKRLDGAAWTGALTYSNINAEAPDFNTPNEAYWTFVDDFLATCESQGVLVFMFPAYVGYQGGNQGWMQEMVANGSARMSQYGAFIATRYRARKNIVWMMGGDMQTFSASQSAVENALIGGLKGVTGQASTHFSAEWSSNSICTDQSTWGGNCTLEGAYSWQGVVVSYTRNGYAHSPTMSAFLLEEPYDEEGPDGNNVNPNATQPVRRFQYWGWLSGVAGYVSGNGYIWAFLPGWQNHLDTPGSRDMARMNGLIRSIAWQNLVPSGLAGMKSLIPSGGGTFGGTDFVASAATPDGTLLVAYVPPTGTAPRTFSVDMTAMSGSTRARWWNPTTAVYSEIATFLPNTGAASFTTPGNNGSGQNDWMLVLAPAAASAPPTVATPAAATPNPVAGTSTALSVLGADDGGEPSLVYTWAATGSAPVSFAANGTNAAKNTTATFSMAGSYTLQATITDTSGQSVTSSVVVTVNPTPAAVVVAPASAIVAPGGTQQFTASATDQFGVALATQPAFTWSVAGGGGISATGLFTAGTTSGGPFAVTAAAGTLNGTASVTVASTSTAVYRVDSGGPAVGSFSSDQFFSGGTPYSTGTAITTSTAANPAPAAVYQTERYGNFTYTLAGLTAGAEYVVRLHFAEIYWTSANSRLFNVSINGTQVLANFDIYAAAGGAFRALSRDFTAAANASGQIVLQYTTVKDNAKSSGIELFAVTQSNAPPTVATAASASPNPVTGTSTALAVLGADDGGEANLTYTWAAVGTPPAPVSFSANGTNAAKNVTATFTRAGAYGLQVTLTDAGGLTATSSVSVTVNQTPTRIAVTPSSATVTAGATQQFSATATDQFAIALANQPAFGWSVSGGGTIGSSGLFTAGSAAGGPFTVTAASGATSGTASVTVSAASGTPTPVYRVDSGGPATGTFSADQFFSAGTTYSTGSAIDTSAVTNPAPAAVYQTERYGNFSYTLPGLTPGAPYDVRLHFAEIYWTTSGSRLFDVSINGTQVLTNFDVFASAGGAFKALERDFNAAANASGQIVVQYTTVKDNAKSSGIELFALPPSAPPTVASPATASPNPVGGTSTALSVLGADDGGEAALTYTWAATGTPPAPVSFSANGTNSAKQTTVSFSKAGGYTLQATITDTSGQSVTSSVSVTVNQTLTGATVAPATATVAPAGTQQFSATATDQFSIALATQPAFTWSVNGGGSIDPTGLFTAGSASGGPFTVSAGAGGVSGSATVTISAGGAMGPLRVSTSNSHYFVDPQGRPVVLAGSHSWDSFQDLSQATSYPYPNLLDFNAYVSFLKAHGHNATILWRKDLPTFFNWGAGGVWNAKQWPWARTGPGNASDGLPKFDLGTFDQTYFDRLRARALQLQQNGIYAIVQLFDGLQLANNRGTGDGYPFSATNNVNGIDDGGGTNSMNATYAGIAAIYAVQDAYVKKVVDTLNDLQNVLWEISEEAPDIADTNGSPTWNEHMLRLLHSYEATKPLQHPAGATCRQSLTDGNLWTSSADWVAPCERVSPTSNQGKVVINDSDHSYFGIWNDTQLAQRNYVWSNFTAGSQVVFMDPYVIWWSVRNECAGALSGVCSSIISSSSSYQENVRRNLGYTLSYANRMSILAMTPQPSLASTGQCLARISPAGAELLVYAAASGSFTVNLAGFSGTLSVEWLDPATGAVTTGSPVTGGGTVQFTTPAGAADAILYLKG